MTVIGDWYDYPQFYDLAFRDETDPEVQFLTAAFQRYAIGTVHRIFEPGCGSGRLVLALSKRGFDVVGLDLNQKSLDYLCKKLKRSHLPQQLVYGDMREYVLSPPADATICTFNTFRQLLTERDAISHLKTIAASLRAGGIYVLGFHIIPLDADEACKEVWRAARGKMSVCITLKVIEFDRRRRKETIRISLLGRNADQTVRCRTEYQMRLYTAKQITSLLKNVPEFELVAIHNFDYQIDETYELDDELTDAVFVLRKK